MKEKWEKPIVTVLFKSVLEQSILDTCTWSTGGGGPNNIYGGCWLTYKTYPSSCQGGCAYAQGM